MDQQRQEMFYAVITILAKRLGGKVEISTQELYDSQQTPGSITTTPNGIVVEIGKKDVKKEGK